MKKLAIALAVASVLLLPDLAHAQVNGGTSRLGFQLRNYGAVRVGTPAYGAIRQVDRMQLNVALDSLHVFDEEEDADTVELAHLISGIADTVATVLADNGYSGLPPNITVRTTAYAWNNDDFFILKFTTKNIHTGSYSLSFGLFVIPKPDNLYGGETVAYDAVKKISYFYRSGGTAYVGVKLLSGDPTSHHALDWDVFSSDPNAEVAEDSTRYRLIVRPGFDTPLTAGVDGSVFNLNAGTRSVASGDSVRLYYAVLYGTSLAALQTASDAAVVRYNASFASVKPISSLVPDGFSLQQNYPNPFNPSTNITFELQHAGLTVLKVYNILGEEIATLVNEQLAPGTYATSFNAENLPTGVYIYKLTSGTYSSTKKMLLTR